MPPLAFLKTPALDADVLNVLKPPQGVASTSNKPGAPKPKALANSGLASRDAILGKLHTKVLKPMGPLSALWREIDQARLNDTAFDGNVLLKVLEQSIVLVTGHTGDQPPQACGDSTPLLEE